MESLYKLAHEKSTDKGTFVKCPLHEQTFLTFDFNTL